LLLPVRLGLCICLRFLGLSVGLQPTKRAGPKGPTALPKAGEKPKAKRPNFAFVFVLVFAFLEAASLDTPATIKSGKKPSPAPAGLSILVP
jgi:hypothetical protein